MFDLFSGLILNGALPSTLAPKEWGKIANDRISIFLPPGRRLHKQTNKTKIELNNPLCKVWSKSKRGAHERIGDLVEPKKPSNEELKCNPITKICVMCTMSAYYYYCKLQCSQCQWCQNNQGLPPLSVYVTVFSNCWIFISADRQTTCNSSTPQQLLVMAN